MKKYFIIGSGISGKGFSQYLNSKNIYNEIYNIYNLEDVKKINWNGDGIYLSPGVNKVYKEWAHLPYISDLDMLYADNLDANFILITGTAGKTTTAYLVSHILSYYNIDHHLCGNMGIDLFKKSKNYIIEVSSFQLSRCYKIIPTIGVITNLYIDHLDIHRTKEEYCAIKYKAINEESKYSHLGSGCSYISHNKLPFLENEYNNLQNKILILEEHNKYNFILAASILNAQYNISIEQSYNALFTFKFPLYRNMLVFQDMNRKIINDSKCTNIIALQALVNTHENIYLICGGILKINLQNINLLNTNKIKVVFLFGPDKQKFYDFFTLYNLKIYVFDSLDLLVQSVILNTGTILFAPVGASYDLYKNYKERGEHFTQLIYKYINK